jgi:hypothetical protein
VRDPFRGRLEPDGQKSHWLKVTKKVREAAVADAGDIVPLEILSVEKEPEPVVGFYSKSFGAPKTTD